jgi:hypothetical protein
MHDPGTRSQVKLNGSCLLEGSYLIHEFMRYDSLIILRSGFDGRAEEFWTRQSPVRYGGGERRSASVGYFPAWVLLASIVHSSVFSYSMVSY